MLLSTLPFTFKERGKFEIKHNSKNQGPIEKEFSDRCVSIRVIDKSLFLRLGFKVITLKERYWFLAISIFI